MSPRRSAALVVGVLIASLTACGGDGGSTPPGPSVTFGTQPPSTTTAPPTTAVAPSVAPTTVASTVPPTTVPLGDPVVALEPVGEFDEPVDVAWRAGDDTMFVVERGGIVVPVRDGVAGNPVLDISDLTEGGGEQGLLGLTFGTGGSAAYVNHTDNDGDTIIAEYLVGDDGTFDASSRRVLLGIDQPYANHNGGDVTIGPDGMLYIGMGDGGSGGDPERLALNVGTLLGKILRIDPTATASTSYRIPPDNPFVGVAGARPEIWSVGVRNPWRMSFDSATGDFWFGDVGQGDIEEIDVAWADEGGGRGFNWGWSAFEGSARFNEDQPAEGATPPIYEYPHGDAGCSVSGGAVYRGTTIPALVGWYVFGDYCSGVITGLHHTDRTVDSVLSLGNLPALVAVRSGPDRELVAVSIDGIVARIVPG